MGVVGVVDSGGVVDGGETTISTPIGANGFGLPSFPSGTRTMLESRKELNALVEKIASFNLIPLTLKRRVRNSCAITEVSPEVVVVVSLTAGTEEIRTTSSSEDDFMKKI